MAKGPETTLRNLALRPEDVPHEKADVEGKPLQMSRWERRPTCILNYQRKGLETRGRSHLGANRSLRGRDLLVINVPQRFESSEFCVQAENEEPHQRLLRSCQATGFVTSLLGRVAFT